VNFSPPTVTDNCPGAAVTCTPPSGSSFPIGTTNVNCTARDAKGVTATCGFTVTVIGLPQAIVRLQGNLSPCDAEAGRCTLDFGFAPARRRIKKLKKQPVRSFSIENVGCTTLVLTFESLERIGEDVDRVRGPITDPDDRALFDLTLLDAAGAERPIELLTDIRILPGQKQNFKIRFLPVIPAVTNRTTDLSAGDVLPDLIESVLTFTQNGGSPLTIRLVGKVDTSLVLIHPNDPRLDPLITLRRVEDEFIIEYSIFDSNADVAKATYQFFDKRLVVREAPIPVDLSGLIRQLLRQGDLIKGQSFTIEQRINGASVHPEIRGVEVIVSDADTEVRAFSDPELFNIGIESFAGTKVSPSIFGPPIGLPKGNEKINRYHILSSRGKK
jgi:hypothetical protein